MKCNILLLLGLFLCVCLVHVATAAAENHDQTTESADRQVSAAESDDHAGHDDAGKQHVDEDGEHEDETDHQNGEPEASGDDQHAGHGDEEIPLRFSEQRLAEFGARMTTAGSGVILQQVTLPGEVQLNREAVAHIVPRFPAKAIKVMARTGDEVKAGQVLGVLESSDTLARFELKSLIAGTVIDRHITLGEVLSDSDTAFVIADLATLWIDIDLYPKQVPQVRPGQDVRIETRHGPAAVNMKIDYVSPLVNERTRTGLARVFLPNEKRLWKPGMFIRAVITLDEQPAGIAVPKSAVIDLEGRPTVFVQHGDEWQPRTVALGREDAGRVEVLQGLQAGERYIAEGGFVLKAQLQKGAFDDGHGH